MKQFEYLTEEEEGFIKKVYFPLRKSRDSQKNIYYILGIFSDYMKKGIFQASQTDAKKYIQTLLNKKNRGELKEIYCEAVFLELRSFYECAANAEVVPYNPFSESENLFRGMEYIKVSELPSVSDIDKLLTLAKGAPMLHAAIVLAFRMALPINEIVNLQKSQIILEDKTGEYYLSIPRIIEKKKQACYLYVPEDVVPILLSVCALTDSQFPAVLQNKHGKVYSIRTLQNQLKMLQKDMDMDMDITFSNIRSLTTYLMVVAQIPIQQISSYTNIVPAWLVKYDYIPSEYKFDAVRYLNIRIVQSEE